METWLWVGEAFWEKERSRQKHDRLVLGFWTFMAMYLRLFWGEEVGKAEHMT
jgi:hypothetical protein